MRRFRRAPLPRVPPFLPAIVAVAACGGEVPVAEVTVTDSAGIRIVDAPREVVDRLEVWRAEEEPRVVVGAADRQGEDLHLVTGALRLDDGRLAVANGGSDEIRFFDAAGRYLGTVGRTGEGPGEFQLPAGLHRGRGDSLVVWDQRLLRLSWLAVDGSGSAGPARVARVETLGPALPPNATVIDLDGGVVLVEAARFVPEGDLRRHFWTLWTYEPGSGALDSLLAVELEPHRNVGLWTGPLLAPRPVALFDGRGRIYFGSARRPEIGLFSKEGRYLETIRWTWDRPIDVEAEREALLSRVVEPLPETERSRMRWRLEELPAVDAPPAYRHALRDRAGNLWLATWTPHGDPEAWWLAFGENGAVTARVRLPADLEPLDAGADYVLGKITGELGLETVALYRLLKAEGDV